MTYPIEINSLQPDVICHQHVKRSCPFCKTECKSISVTQTMGAIVEDFYCKGCKRKWDLVYKDET